MNPGPAVIVALSLAPLTVAGADTVRLVGTVVLSGDAREPSHAVFETGDGRQLILDVGQEVDGCRLVRVLPRQATMDCADGLVSLTLRSGLHSRDNPPERGGDSYQVTLPREAFVLALDDHQRIANQASLEPVVRDGWMYGYLVAWLEPGGDFYRLGLREDDVVIRLNGVPASTPGPFMQAVSALRGQTAFQLTVDRGGRVIDYSYLFD